MNDVDSPISFAPDGKHFVFVRESRAEPASSLMIANVDGSGERKLVTRTPPKHFATEGPAWSPDGKRIAVGASDSLDNTKMYVDMVDAVSGRELPLGASSWVYPRRIVWLPDGNNLVFASSAAGGSSLNPQLWEVSYPNGEARRITNDLNLYAEETITADGSAIVAVQRGFLGNLWVVPAEAIAQSSSAKQITPGSNRADGFLGLSWIPDGGILYGYYDRGEGRLATISANGNKSADLRFPAGFYYAPSACGDGRTIVFGGVISGTRGIWRADSDGSNLLNIVNAEAFAPTCSPDSKSVVYTATSANETRLWRVSTEGGQPVRLNDESLLFSAISPNGRSIAALTTRPLTGLRSSRS